MRIPRSHRRLRAPVAMALAAVSVGAVPATSADASQSLHVTRHKAAKACRTAHRTKTKKAKRRCTTLYLRFVKAKKRYAIASAAYYRQHPHRHWHQSTTSTTSTPTTTTTTTVPTTTTTVPTTSTTASAPTTTTSSTATGSRLYADSSAFNTKIPANPRIASNSAAMVAKSVTPYAGSANFANSDWWGVPIVKASGSDPLRSVGLFDWGYGSSSFPSVRIPNGASPTLGSDHHLVVLDGTQELDMWVAEQQSDGSWKAGSRVLTSTDGDGIAGGLASDAAGFSLAAGVIRPEEIQAGRIDHALVFTSPYIRNSYVAPAVHTDGKQSDGDAMPMGTHIQLDPSVDISGLPRYKRIVAQALKDYGAYLVDSSGSLAIRGEASIGRASQGGPSDIWSPVGVTDDSLSGLPWGSMRVVAP